MKSINKPAILSIVVVAAFSTAFLTKAACSKNSCIDINDKKDWTLENTYLTNSNYWKGLYRHPHYQIRFEQVRNVNPQRATELTTITTMQIQGLFEESISPYPGAISDTITCDDSYIPIEYFLTTSDGTSIQCLSAHLNSRLQYGSCTENEAIYTSHSSIFYCHNHKSWYHLELITPSSDPLASEEEIINDLKSINCLSVTQRLTGLVPVQN